MTDRIGRITLHDSNKRECAPEFSPVALLAQRLAFIGRGGVIQKIPPGVTAYEHNLRPNKPKAPKRKIRMEDGL